MSLSKFDPKLVRRAQQGDESSRNLLLQRLSKVFESFFKGKLGNQAVVDDLVQCSLLRVHSGLKALQQMEKFKAFAMKAALFELHDYYRGRHSPKERTYEPQLLPENKDYAKPSSEAAIDVDKALALLKPHARKILELREHGYKYKEIAEMLGTTETAAKMQVQRAFEKMRTIFVE